MARFVVIASSFVILTVSDALDHLVSTILRQPAGLGVDALFHTLGRSVPRRTLQRRLAGLVQARRLVLVGQGRSARYTAASPTAVVPVVPALSLQWPGAPYRTEPYPPISPQGDAIKALVRRALHLRPEAHYQPSFLEDYRRQLTAYLPSDARESLRAAGTRPQAAEDADWAQACWASVRLEGCRHSLDDVQAWLTRGEVAPSPCTRDIQMVLNHQQALRYVHDLPVAAPLALATVLDVHALLSDGLLHPSAMGRLRRRAAEVAGSVYRPLSEPQRIQDALEVTLRTAAEIEDPFEQSFFLFVHMSYLLPFDACSHAVARVVASIPLLRQGLLPMTFQAVPPRAYRDGLLGLYERTQVALLRDVWVAGYLQACQPAAPTMQPEVRATPADIRLRYRHPLRAVVVAMVRALEPAHTDAVRARMPSVVKVADHTLFCTVVLAELQALHAGNAVRFGLRPLELAVWLQQHMASAHTR